ncbi:MAG: hypothetical protein IJ929_04245 [Prevotella sp.]|nr:hypothetical protein [Prevotella sp.]
MKHRFLYIMALLLMVAVGARAQDPTPIDLMPSADGTEWTLATMPEYDVELEVTYYTDEEVAAMEEAAYTTGVELTKTGDGEWTLAATPEFDVELEVEYETALALNETDDNSAKLTEWNGYEADVTLTRTLTAGSWNTFAVPFNVNAATLAGLKLAKDVTVKELTSASFANGKLTLNFADAASIEAGKPYLVKVTSDFDLSTIAFPGAIVSKTAVPTVIDNVVTFQPLLSPTVLTANDKTKLYLGSGTKTLYYPTADITVKAFRAFFQLTSEAAEAREFNLNIDGEQTTGIDATLVNSEKVNSDVYDLQGRKVIAMQKGVYVKNGRKVIIK